MMQQHAISSFEHHIYHSLSGVFSYQKDSCTFHHDELQSSCHVSEKCCCKYPFVLNSFWHTSQVKTLSACTCWCCCRAFLVVYEQSLQFSSAEKLAQVIMDFLMISKLIRVPEDLLTCTALVLKSKVNHHVLVMTTVTVKVFTTVSAVKSLSRMLVDNMLVKIFVFVKFI